MVSPVDVHALEEARVNFGEFGNQRSEEVLGYGRITQDVESTIGELRMMLMRDTRDRRTCAFFFPIMIGAFRWM